MPEQPLDLKPEAALVWWRNRGLRISDDDFRRASQRAQDLAFTIAHVRQIKVLQAFHTQIDAALDKGLSFDQIRKGLQEGLRGAMPDATATDYEKALVNSIRQRINDPYLRTIFRTNMSMAQNAGHWQEHRAAVADGQERLVVYHAIHDSNTRDSHAVLDGLARPHDDPIWETHWPPNGFNCRCGVSSMPKSLAQSRGIQVTAQEERDMLMSLHGPAPGFGRAPGNSPLGPHVQDILNTIQLRSKDAGQRKANLDKLKSLGPAASTAIEENFSDAVDVFAVTGHNVSSRNKMEHIAGLLPASAGSEVQGYAVVVSDSSMKDAARHLRRVHGLDGLERIGDVLQLLPAVILEGRILHKDVAQRTVWMESEKHGYVFKLRYRKVRDKERYVLEKIPYIPVKAVWREKIDRLKKEGEPKE